jgi:hypothetical protein
MRNLLIIPMLISSIALSACGDSGGPETPAAVAANESKTVATATAATAPVITAPTQPEEIAVFKVKVGDCLNGDAGSGAVDSMTRVGCGEPHLYEAYHLEAMPDGDFPGEKKVSDLGESVCKANFAAFVGKSFDDSELTLTSLYPTDQSWNSQNDRELVCLITTQDDSKRSGSAKNSKA